MHKPPDHDAAHTPDAGKVTESQAHPSLGFESSDVNASSVMVFLASLAGFVLVFFVFCYAMGKVINNALVEHDGPADKWHQLGAIPHQRGKSMQSTVVMEQQQLQTMTQRFPSPRVQRDDGNQDLADMHQKEDLLLDHYSWVDRGQGKVRIPIDRAMELIVERGLPVAPATVPADGGTPAPGVVGNMDQAHSITPPLTNGFARTTYEQEAAQEEMRPAHPAGNEQSRNKKPVAKPVQATQAGGVQ